LPRLPTTSVAGLPAQSSNELARNRQIDDRRGAQIAITIPNRALSTSRNGGSLAPIAANPRDAVTLFYSLLQAAREGAHFPAAVAQVCR